MKDSEGNFRTDVVLSDRDTHVPFSDKLRFVFLQLPCFKKEESECENDFERWIYVLKNMETLQRLPFKARKSVFEKLEQIVDIASLSKEERMKYDESIKVYRDQLATLDFAKQKGRAEERLDIAKKMKASSVPVETISPWTRLPGCDRMILFRFHDVNMVGRLMDIPFQNGLRSFFLHKNNRVHLNGLFYSSFGCAQCLFE